MKKPKFTLLLLLFATSSLTFSQKDNMGVGTKTPDSTALLDLDPPNKDKGLLIPRLTTADRDGIVNPAESLLIFNIDMQCYEGYSAQESKWFSFGCFEFSCGLSFTDERDGNKYKTTQIGNQCWMAENLKYLPEVIGPKVLVGDIPPINYYVYGYDGTDTAAAKVYDVGNNGVPYYITHGVLYNWTAAMGGSASSDANPSGVRGACPMGWHVPSDAEWCEMEQVVEATIPCTNGDSRGAAQGADNQLKSTSWVGVGANLGGDGTDAYGFTALPTGWLVDAGPQGEFIRSGERASWWTATHFEPVGGANAFSRGMRSDKAGIRRIMVVKKHAFSLRCVQD